MSFFYKSAPNQGGQERTPANQPGQGVQPMPQQGWNNAMPPAPRGGGPVHPPSLAMAADPRRGQQPLNSVQMPQTPPGQVERNTPPAMPLGYGMPVPPAQQYSPVAATPPYGPGGQNQQYSPVAATPPYGPGGQNQQYVPPPMPAAGLPIDAAGMQLLNAPMVPRQGQNLEVVNGNVILYRNPNFFVRTAFRLGQRVSAFRKSAGNIPFMPGSRPLQEERIANTETRMMPNIDLLNEVDLKKQRLPRFIEALPVLFGLFLTFVSHAYNMFGFPNYELDEGTYISNAWAITIGKIEPYAYGYGHPPGAWIQLAGLISLIGGFFTFGNALNTGRVIMLFYALASALLVYLIVRRLGASRGAGLLAMIVFSLSPISVTFQRQIYLDNIGTFWLLLALYLVVISKSRLPFIVLSAIALGVAFYSKEIFILFLPCMIYATWLYTTKFQRKFALVAFTYASLAVVSSFVLLATLKGELFPTGFLPGDTHQHLSLIGTYLGQVGRGQNQGSILTSWTVWKNTDWLFAFFSVATTIFSVVIGWWQRRQLLMGLLAVSMWFLLIRGGVVFPFYIIPLIPLVAINTALTFSTIVNWLAKLVRLNIVQPILLFGLALALIPYFVQPSSFPYTQDTTAAQNEAMTWIRNNVPRNAYLVTSTYLYVDLHVPGGQGVGNGAPFLHNEIYINVATDPELYQGQLQGNWDRIDYIIADSAVETYINTQIPKSSPGYILKEAYDHSVQIAQFQSPEYGGAYVIKVYQVQHKNPAPIVQASPTTSTNAVAQSTMPVDRRSSIG